MTSFADAILKHCPGIAPASLEMHLARTPESYQEHYGPAEIARHLRMLARLNEHQFVDVEVRSLGGKNLEVSIVGFDRTGVLASLTTALASEGLDVQDLQLATYLPPQEENSSEPTYFVDVVRVTGGRRGLVVAEIAKSLRERLNLAFTRLAEGDFAAAQTAASDSHWTPGSTSGRPRPAVIPAVKEGLVLDGFRLDERLAVGGMSEVYLATQLSLGRKAAVKLVTGDMRGGELDVRFAKEAQVLAGFTSPYIVQVLTAGSSPMANGTSLRWLAMEFLPNGDLARCIKRHGPPPAEVAARWFLQALEGLQYAHQHGTLHRDLKPQNILLTADGDIKLCDFGLVKHTHREEQNLTAHGSILGTPQYLSPEQALGDEADERSDVYSLGAAFFQILGGRLTFDEKNATSVLLRISRDQAPRLCDVAPKVPRPLGVIVDRMLALRPDERYQNVHVILEDLRSYVQRGLLRAADQGWPMDQAPPPGPDAMTTQAMRPPNSDEVAG